MSRSGYSDECDGWDLIRWRGAVSSAIKGKRGQQFLKDLLSALDAMPIKELIAHELIQADGEVCALGAIGYARGLDMTQLDPYESDDVAEAFHVAPALVKEIVFENDEGWYGNEDRKKRWERMRAWVDKQIIVDQAKPCGGEHEQR